MVLGTKRLRFIAELEAKRIFIRLYKATYTKESPCLLPNKYSTTTRGLTIYKLLIYFTLTFAALFPTRTM